MPIRPYTEHDWPALWVLLESTFAAGDSYVFDAATSADAAHALWTQDVRACFVAHTTTGQLAGSYYLKANQPGRGSHIGNCGYVVDPAVRGQGWAQALYAHSEQEARACGFSALQFNCVVSSNQPAVRLWQKLGFQIIGVVPRAFMHARLGPVDTLILHRTLCTEATPAMPCLPDGLFLRALLPTDATHYRSCMGLAHAEVGHGFYATLEEFGARSLESFQRRLTPAADAPFSVFGIFDGTHCCALAGLAFQNGLRSAHKARIFDVFVLPPYRRQGLAHILVAHLLDIARARPGVRCVHLSVTEHNAAALALYRRLGFVIYGREPDALTLPSGPQACLHLWRAL